jgi:DNA-binding transcriptional MerR regulator
VENRYPIRSAAKIAGLSIDLLRAWERRYHAVVPERGNRGRLYTPEQIERLILLRQLVERGHAIGTIASLDEVALQRLLDQPTAKTAPSSKDLIAPILECIDRFDQSGANQEVGRLAALLSPRSLVYHVVLPLMHEIGERWHNGALMIAQEHLASAIIRNLLGGMVRLHQAPDDSRRVILATPAGELHEFGSLAAAMLVAISRLDPIYLGPDLPASELIEAARRTGARSIVVGITTAANGIGEELATLKAGLPEPIELWIGGAGIDNLDNSMADGQTVFLRDFAALESECRRLGGRI